VPKAKSAPSPPSPAAPPAPAPQWLNWQCDACRANNRTRTRRAKQMTCPRCGHVQLGAEAKADHERRLAERERYRRSQGRKGRIRVQGDRPPAPDPPPAPPAPPTKSPPGFFDRILGYD
jgi:hypothetical protein